MNQNATRKLMLILLGVVSTTGCREKDRYREVAEIATQAADRQAQQNSEMARVHREVAEGTRRMVEADAEARKEIITVHQDIQAERATLSDGFDKLETERKEIAQVRRTESILIPAAKIIGGAALALAVVLFCWTLLVGLRGSDSTDADVSELLISDLVSEQPRLLTEPHRLDRISPPLLTAADETKQSDPQGDRD
jgi:hypothetical protein